MARMALFNDEFPNDFRSLSILVCPIIVFDEIQIRSSPNAADKPLKGVISFRRMRSSENIFLFNRCY